MSRFQAFVVALAISMVFSATAGAADAVLTIVKIECHKQGEKSVDEKLKDLAKALTAMNYVRFVQQGDRVSQSLGIGKTASLQAHGYTMSVKVMEVDEKGNPTVQIAVIKGKAAILDSTMKLAKGRPAIINIAEVDGYDFHVAFLVG